MKRFSYTEYAEVRLDVLTTVSDDGAIRVDILVPTHGRAHRVVGGTLEYHDHRGWVVIDENDQHTGIIEPTKKAAIQRFTRRQMALMAGWAVNDTVDMFKPPKDPAAVA
jgi:hypothetical protein